jgi:alpha-glucosidase (family GH31 glycosyl hydrolase)
MNSAETFVDIYSTSDNPYGFHQTDLQEMQYRNRSTVWTTESGTMEFFIFGAFNRDEQGPKILINKLATITGYLPLPPYHTLGFHYSKWEQISTYYLISLLDEFNEL